MHASYIGQTGPLSRLTARPELRPATAGCLRSDACVTHVLYSPGIDPIFTVLYCGFVAAACCNHRGVLV